MLLQKLQTHMWIWERKGRIRTAGDPLVRCKAASAAAPVPSAISTPGHESTPNEAPSATPAKASTSSAAPAHSRNVRALGHNLQQEVVQSACSDAEDGRDRERERACPTHLDVAALENALVEDQSLGNEAGLGELNIGVSAHGLTGSDQRVRAGLASLASHVPLGLSSKLVQ